MSDVNPETVELDVSVVVKKYQDRLLQVISTNVMLETQLEAVMTELAELKAKERSQAPSNGSGTTAPSLVVPSS